MMLIKIIMTLSLSFLPKSFSPLFHSTYLVDFRARVVLYPPATEIIFFSFLFPRIVHITSHRYRQCYHQKQQPIHQSAHLSSGALNARVREQRVEFRCPSWACARTESFSSSRSSQDGELSSVEILATIIWRINGHPTDCDEENATFTVNEAGRKFGRKDFSVFREFNIDVSLSVVRSNLFVLYLFMIVVTCVNCSCLKFSKLVLKVLSVIQLYFRTVVDSLIRQKNFPLKMLS